MSEPPPAVTARAREDRGEPTPDAQESGLYSIGELARLAEVSARTIRYYEEIGLLRTARRFAGGRRAFDGDALERLRFIGRLKRLGLALEEIRHLNDVFAMQHSTEAMLRELERLLGRHLETITERIRDLTALRQEIGAYRERIRGRLSGDGDAKRPSHILLPVIPK
jgi:DNA-binding transcriptional MerR regulator